MSGRVKFPDELAPGRGNLRHTTQLECGHSTTRPPIANQANGAGRFWCDSCGLVGAVRRR